MKLIFFQYILKQKEDSLMFKFLMAKKYSPTKGDWFSDVMKIMEEFQINKSEDDLKKTSKEIFKRIVRQKAEIVGLKYLHELQKKCEKGSRIQYNSLELQDYLSPSSNISIENQRFLFSIRCEMNMLKSNFTRNKSINSTFCINSCKKELNNEHLVYCKESNGNSSLRYENILNGSLQDKVETLNQVKLNEKKRNLEKETL